MKVVEDGIEADTGDALHALRREAELVRIFSRHREYRAAFSDALDAVTEQATDPEEMDIVETLQDMSVAKLLVDMS